MKSSFFLLAISSIFLFGTAIPIQTQAQTIDELQTILDQLRAQIQSLIQKNSDAQLAQSNEFEDKFTRDLEAGDQGEDVRLLQQLLNRITETRLAPGGLGSSGNETDFFGSLTYQAVINFQNKYRDEILTPLNLTKPTGYVGSSTLKKLRSLFFNNQSGETKEDTTENDQQENDEENQENQNENNDSTLKAPSPVRTSISPSRVYLSWGEVEGAEYYRVKRKTGSSGDYTNIADNLTQAFYNDQSVKENTNYYYYIVAVKDGEEGESSIIVEADVPRRSGGGGGDEEVEATLPFTNFTINSDGWTASTTIGAAVDGGTYTNLNSSSSPGIALTVTSTSWTTSGTQTTTTRTVYATAIKRFAYPNHANLLEIENGADLDVQFALSEYIYADDTVTASVAAGFFTDDGAGGSGLTNTAQTPTVTNSSTFTYPEPQAVWLMPDRQHATTTTFAPKLFVMHRFGQQGQPVRAVKFIATDESANSVSAIATSLSREQYSASGLYSNFFTANLDFSSLTEGDLVTIDATIYPWVGDSYTISTDAETYPSANLTILKVLKDANDDDTVYAYVDGVGSGGGEAVSQNAVTASTTPYANIAAAATAIQTFNNSNFGRNNVSGGVIRISAGTTITGLGSDVMDSTLFDGDVPLVIEGVNKTTSIYTNEATVTNNDINDQVKFRNLTFKKTGASVVGIDGGSANNSNLLVFEDVIFDGNGQAVYNAWIYRFGRAYFINCSGDYVGQGAPFSTSKMGTALSLGGDFLPTSPYNAVSNNAVTSIALGSGSRSFMEDYKGIVFAFNFFRYSSSGSKVIVVGDLDLGNRGLAVIGNILEKYDVEGVAPTLSLFADGDTTSATNTVEVMNTVVGNRTNILYNETGSSYVLKAGMSQHSIHRNWNSKADVFGTNGNLIGNWALRYKVGGGYNFIDIGDSGGDTSPGPTTWLGEILHPGDVVTGNPDFTNDQSGDGGAGGNGDYSLGASTDVPQIPSGETMFGWDLYGTAIPTDGSAYAGAVQ